MRTNHSFMWEKAGDKVWNHFLSSPIHPWTFSFGCNTQWRKKNAFFQIIVACFDYLHWLLNYRKLYRKDGVLLAVHMAGASPQSSASHLLTFLVAQLQFLREWKLSDRRLYEVIECRLLIGGNPKERNSPDIYPFQKHAFFLRHPVLMIDRVKSFG